MNDNQKQDVSERKPQSSLKDDEKSVNPITEMVENFLNDRKKMNDEIKENNMKENVKDITKEDEVWSLNVRLRDDVSKCGVREWQPLVHSVEYIIENLTVSSDGKVLVDVYLPETMGLIREKIDIDVFYILPTNDKYNWHVLLLDTITKQIKNYIVVESYYCVAPPSKQKVVSNMMNTSMSEVISYETRMLLCDDVRVYSSTSSDLEEMNRLWKEKTQERWANTIPVNQQQPYMANGYPIMNTCPPPIPGMTYPMQYQPHSMNAPIRLDSEYVTDFVNRYNEINKRFSEEKKSAYDQKEKSESGISIMEDGLDFINKEDSEN